MSSKEAKFIIKADNQAKQGIDSAVNDLFKLDDASKKIGDTIKGAFAVTAIVAGLKQLGEAALGCVKEFGDVERTMLGLKSALDGNERSFEKATNLIDDMSRKTLASKDEIEKLVLELAALGKSDAEIEKLTKASVNLSNVTGKDLNSSFTLLNSTYDGSVGKLGKLIPELNNLTKEQLATGNATDVVINKFNSVSENMSKGISQNINNLKTNFTELKEELGRALAPSFGPIIDWFNSLIGKITETLAKWNDLNTAMKGDTSSASVKALQDRLSQLEALRDKASNELVERKGQEKRGDFWRLPYSGPQQDLDNYTRQIKEVSVLLAAALLKNDNTERAIGSSTGPKPYETAYEKINELTNKLDKSLALNEDGLMGADKIAQTIAKEFKSIMYDYGNDLGSEGKANANNLSTRLNSLLIDNKITGASYGSGSGNFNWLNGYGLNFSGYGATGKSEASYFDDISGYGNTSSSMYLEQVLGDNYQAGNENTGPITVALNKIEETLKDIYEAGNESTGGYNLPIPFSDYAGYGNTSSSMYLEQILGDNYQAGNESTEGYSYTPTNPYADFYGYGNTTYPEMMMGQTPQWYENMSGYGDASYSAIARSSVAPTSGDGSMGLSFARTGKENYQPGNEESGGYQSPVVGGMEGGTELGFGSDLSALSGMFGILTGTIKPLIDIFTATNPIMVMFQKIFEGFMKVIGPAVTQIMKPFFDALQFIGELAGKILLPILDALAPVFSIIGQLLITVFGPVLMLLAPIIQIVATVLDIVLTPALKLVATEFEVLMSPVKFLADLFTWVADVIKVFGDNIGIAIHNLTSHWFGGSHSFNEGPGEFKSDAFTGLADRIAKIWDTNYKSNTSGMEGTTTGWQNLNNTVDTGVTTASYGGASYKGSSQVIINIYQNSPVVGDDGMTAFASMIRQKFIELAYFNA